MPFIGNQPALSYTSFAKQDFTTSATTSYTLDNPVANANELALFINFVRQEPTTAYSASGTSLTLTSATSVGDDMYCVFLGKAVQTVNPPNASVGTAQLSASGTKDATTFLRGDNTFASAGGVNTPAFSVYKSSSQSLSDNVNTKVSWNAEFYDTDSAFTSNKFTVPSGKDGKYFLHTKMYSTCSGNSNFNTAELMFYKNGARIDYVIFDFRDNPGHQFTVQAAITLPLVATDYVEVYLQVDDTSGNPSISGTSTVTDGIYRSIFEGFKIIE